MPGQFPVLPRPVVVTPVVMIPARVRRAPALQHWFTLHLSGFERFIGSMDHHGVNPALGVHRLCHRISERVGLADVDHLDSRGINGYGRGQGFPVIIEPGFPLVFAVGVHNVMGGGTASVPAAVMFSPDPGHMQSSLGTVVLSIGVRTPGLVHAFCRGGGSHTFPDASPSDAFGSMCRHRRHSRPASDRRFPQRPFGS